MPVSREEGHLLPEPFLLMLPSILFMLNPFMDFMMPEIRRAMAQEP